MKAALQTGFFERTREKRLWSKSGGMKEVNENGSVNFQEPFHFDNSLNRSRDERAPNDSATLEASSRLFHLMSGWRAGYDGSGWLDGPHFGLAIVVPLVIYVIAEMNALQEWATLGGHYLGFFVCVPRTRLMKTTRDIQVFHIAAKRN